VLRQFFTNLAFASCVQLERRVDTVFNSLVRELSSDKETLVGNIMLQIEKKGADESLLTCYRIYEAYVNSILLDLRKGNTVVRSALLYFETLRQNGKLGDDLARKLADLTTDIQKWPKHWDEQIARLLDHFNTIWEQFAINRSATPPPVGGGPAPAQGINPFFFPDDAREAFRAADGFCSIQQDSYGLRGRIFSMGGQFKGSLKFKDGATASATETAVLKINRKLDYWSATEQEPTVYNKVQFSDQWTVHRYHIKDAAAGTKELGIRLPYTAPAAEVTKCNRETLRPSSSADAAPFGSFVEITRAGGSFAFLSGAWNPGSEDKDASNTTNLAAVVKVSQLWDVPEFKIRYGQTTIGKIRRPEVGLLKSGHLLRTTSGHSLEGTYRTWLETAKTIEFPTTSANEHIRLVWSLDSGRRQTGGLATADDLNKALRWPGPRLTQPKGSITDEDVRSKRFIIGVNYDPTAAIPDQGCRLYAGVGLYPVWDGQKANAGGDYAWIRNSAQAGARQVGVFREEDNKDNLVAQPLYLPKGKNLRFRFEAFYDLRVETSGLDATPFALYARAELENAYLELVPRAPGGAYNPGELTLTKMLQRPEGRCFAFDYDHSGLLDHVVYYDGAVFIVIYGHVGNMRLEKRPLIWGEGRDWELKGAADQVFGFDYASSGKLDHLVFYRPGDGKISIFRNRYGTLERVLSSDGGLPGFNLKNAADRGFAFDFGSTGKLDHLVFYRSGEILIWRKQDSGDFGIVYRSSSNQEIGGYRLQSAADRVFAFDGDGNGHMDHLVLYRPGPGKISIVKRSTFNNQATFTPVYTSETNGIGGYDLGKEADQGMAFDCDGTGRMEYLVFYRPGRGAIHIFKKNDQGTFDKAVYRHSEGDNPGNGIGGYDLRIAGDRIIAFDYNGTGQSDHLMLYRPGTGVFYVVKQTGKAGTKEFRRVQ
jgi:hypothetical protein